MRGNIIDKSQFRVIILRLGIIISLIRKRVNHNLCYKIQIIFQRHQEIEIIKEL